MTAIGAILFHTGILAASLTIIGFAGNYFVEALSSYARKLGMSKYFIGMVVVAIATSSPDIFTSFMGLLAGKPEMLSGILLGGLMLDLAFFNGVFAVLSKRINLETDVIKGIELVVLGLMLLPYVLMLDGEISKSEGFAMMLSFIIYVLLMWNREKGSGKLKQKIPLTNIWRDMLVFVFALGAMFLAARYAVFSSIMLSSTLNIPIYLLSITVLAFAAATPDAIAGIIAILKGRGGEIGFGENVGTTFMEINFFTGLVAIFYPMNFGIMATIAGIIGLMVSATFFLVILRKGYITREQGYVFLLIYAAYMTFEVTRVLIWG
ncbi:MAG: hypothetical protein QXR48_00030 [Candidatus Woesearchaeota archaeon]